MNASDLLTTRLATEEGFRAIAYRDTVGRLSVGYGFNVDAGITQYAAHALLEAQVQELLIELGRLPWFLALDPVRQSVIGDIAFNDGLRGLLGFINMIHYVALSDWPNASRELLDSRAAQELPDRYRVLAQLLLTGAA